MGEIIFSLFVGLYFVAVGVFMNWYLKKEMKQYGTENGDQEGGKSQ